MINKWNIYAFRVLVQRCTSPLLLSFLLFPPFFCFVSLSTYTVYILLGIIFYKNVFWKQSISCVCTCARACLSPGNRSQQLIRDDTITDWNINISDTVMVMAKWFGTFFYILLYPFFLFYILADCFFYWLLTFSYFFLFPSPPILPCPKKKCLYYSI